MFLICGALHYLISYIYKKKEHSNKIHMISKFYFEKVSCCFHTGQSLYNATHYNTVLDITRSCHGSQMVIFL